MRIVIGSIRPFRKRFRIDLCPKSRSYRYRYHIL
jgi:hypothetical protein